MTHNIEEAALLADRILIFDSDPGHVRAELKVDLPQPRNDQSPEFRRIVDKIYTLLTTGPQEIARRTMRERQITIGYRLPDVDPSLLAGLIETMNAPEFSERIDLPELADELMMDIDDLFPLMETLEILGFAKVAEGDIQLRDTGKKFAEADILEKKKIFATQLTAKVPLARLIRQTLDERRGNRASEERFLTKLEDYLSEEAAEEALTVAIDWARYAEMFAYDYNTGVLSLENPE